MADLDLRRPAQPLGQPPARPCVTPGRTQGIRRRGHGRRQDLTDGPLGQHPPGPARPLRVFQPGEPGLGVCRRPDDRRLGGPDPPAICGRSGPRRPAARSGPVSYPRRSATVAGPPSSSPGRHPDWQAHAPIRHAPSSDTDEDSKRNTRQNIACRGLDGAADDLAEAAGTAVALRWKIAPLPLARTAASGSRTVSVSPASSSASRTWSSRRFAMSAAGSGRPVTG